MIVSLLIVLCLVISGASHTLHDVQNTLKEDLELERQLKLVNKPPVKSIHTKFGDIVDCIDINKQPAFDHPLLKNHKLQRKPSFQKTIGITSVKKSSTRSIFGLEKDQYCPKGTVPIQRTTKDDLIRGKSLLNYHIMTDHAPALHIAELTPKSEFAPYYGVTGTNSIYNPKVGKNQVSGSSIWVENGPKETNNKIAAGWMVYPDFHGDDGTHLYAIWTSDNFVNTGCYNMRCPGFVQTHPGNYLGRRFANVSTYDGETWEFLVSIIQDPKTKNWWLNIEGNNIGYYPVALFSDMASAGDVGWGGATRSLPGALSPQMGSGYFPDHNFKHACYFKQISFRFAPERDYSPKRSEVATLDDGSKCFSISYYGEEDQYALQFGGPGGNCGD